MTCPPTSPPRKTWRWQARLSLRSMSTVVALCVATAACGEAKQPAVAEEPAPQSNRAWMSGVACAEGDPNAAFGPWRGEPVTIAGIWADKDEPNQRHVYWMDQFADWAGSMDIAPGILDRSEKSTETYAEAARGAYDERWRHAMQSVHRRWGNKSTIYIRPAHEMNGNWYRWAVNASNVEDFKRAWIRYHAIVQAELVAKGKDAKLVFNPNWDSHSNVSIDTIYPGDAYVDVIGVDYYDHFPSTDDRAEWQAKLHSTRNQSPRGIGAWREWAAGKGKPMAFPEWGVRPEAAHDNPFFVRQMHEFFRRHAGSGPGQVIYEIYFNCYDATRLNPRTRVPSAAVEYQRLKWGTPQP
jgi:hypothetical protein